MPNYDDWKSIRRTFLQSQPQRERAQPNVKPPKKVVEEPKGVGLLGAVIGLTVSALLALAVFLTFAPYFMETYRALQGWGWWP